MLKNACRRYVFMTTLHKSLPVETFIGNFVYRPPLCPTSLTETSWVVFSTFSFFHLTDQKLFSHKKSPLVSTFLSARTGWTGCWQNTITYHRHPDNNPAFILHSLVQRAWWQLGFLHLSIAASFGLRDVPKLFQHGCSCCGYNPKPISNPCLKRVVPVIAGYRDHSRGERIWSDVWVARGQAGHDPDVAEPGQAQWSGLLQDVSRLDLGAVQEDDWRLHLLQLDQGPGVPVYSIQGDGVLEVPTDKAVVDRGLQDGNEILVAWELAGHYGEDVPVVLFHDVEHEQRLLLDGGSKLEECWFYILLNKER